MGLVTGVSYCMLLPIIRCAACRLRPAEMFYQRMLLGSNWSKRHAGKTHAATERDHVRQDLVLLEGNMRLIARGLSRHAHIGAAVLHSI